MCLILNNKLKVFYFKGKYATYGVKKQKFDTDLNMQKTISMADANVVSKHLRNLLTKKAAAENLLRKRYYNCKCYDKSSQGENGSKTYSYIALFSIHKITNISPQNRSARKFKKSPCFSLKTIVDINYIYYIVLYYNTNLLEH